MMQNQGKRRIKCSIASGLNTDFDKGNQEIEITSLRNCYLTYLSPTFPLVQFFYFGLQQA